MKSLAIVSKQRYRDAQVSITEINIEDLEGEGAWAPNLIGLADGGTEPIALATYGMSDFYFSKDGRELQLRPGVQATIELDLLTSVIWPEGEDQPLEAVEGSTLPLWHYDVDEMIWKEEGLATISANDESDSGFSASGQVSHFSSWNIDVVTPSLMANVNIELVDQAGQPIPSAEVESYHTVVRIPPEEGPGWHSEASWRNSKSMTPSSNQIQVLGNTAAREWLIERYDSITGMTVMDIIVDDVVVDGAVVNSGSLLQKKTFIQNSGDYTVTFRIEVDMEPVDMLADVNVVLVDFEGQPIDNVDILGFTLNARTSGSSWENTVNFSSARNDLGVQGNPEALVDAGLAVTTIVSIDNISIEEPYRIMRVPASQTKVFKSYEGDNSMTFNVVVLPQ